MNRKRTLLVGAAVAALAIVATPVTAQADGSGSAQQRSASAAGPDGELHVWADEGRRGGECTWAGDSSDWGHLPGGCGNWASSLENRGYPGSLDDVWVYSKTDNAGFRRGVHNGRYLSNLNLPYDGHPDSSLNNTISSHKWTNL